MKFGTAPKSIEDFIKDIPYIGKNIERFRVDLLKFGVFKERIS
jgi:hypothetical protein